MAAPATDWTLIRITGHLRDWSANELTGTITFTPNVDHAESDATNMMVLPSTLTGTFVAGIMKDAALNPYMDIPATTDPDIQPSGWSYHMVIATPLKTIAWDVSVPFDAAGGTLDLTDLTPVTPAAPVVGAGAATQWTSGAGSPEGAVTGAIGDIWSRTDGAAGTTLYTKQSGTGNTGWAPLVPNGRQITAGSGLTGGGDFSADRTLAASYGTPGASAVGDTAAAGSATTVAHSDHRHSREAFGAVTAATIGAASANGSAATVSHSDHNHGLPASAVADVTGLTAALAAKAPLASPALTGTPTAPTASAATNSTQIATTAYTDGAVTTGIAGKANTAHTHAESDVTSLTSDLAARLAAASNLSDLASASTARTNLGLGNVDNTSNTTERAATATLTNKSISGATNTLTAIPESAVTNLTTDLAAKLAAASNLSDVASAATARTNLAVPPTTRLVTAGTGLTGGGDLSADRTLTVAYGTSSSTAAVGNDPRLDSRRGHPITAGGEWARDRGLFATNATPMTSGTMQLTYFVATATETINTVAIWTAGTAAATITLVRYGVYTVAGNGDLTLINSTVNDTALLIATNTKYPKALSAAWSKVAGTLYAVGPLIVATTMPTVFSDQAQGAQVASDVWFAEPRRCAGLASQSDLPATVTNASLAATRRHAFVEMTT